MKERQGANAQSKTTNEKKMVCGKRGEERRGEERGEGRANLSQEEAKGGKQAGVKFNSTTSKPSAWLGLAWLGLAWL